MKRVFGVKKDKTPGPTVEEATERVSSVSLFNFVCVCVRPRKTQFLVELEEGLDGLGGDANLFDSRTRFPSVVSFSFSCR